MGWSSFGQPAFQTIAKNEPVGEAWLLSDRDDYPSLVANGPLKGFMIAKLMLESQEERFQSAIAIHSLLKKMEATDKILLNIDTQ